MSVAALADLVLREPALAASMEDAKQGVTNLDLTGPAALRPFVVRGLVDAGRTVLVVAATVREAEDLTEELQDLLDPESVALYPAWETLPHERLSPRSDTVGRRLAVLRRIKHPGVEANNGPLKVIVAPVRSVLQPQVKGLADLEPVELARGQEVELEDVVNRLAGAAYSRVDLVEKRGEFAVRGGIVDVFPPTEEHPLRVEFFGDEIDEIRAFAVADQRTLEPVERVWAPPCRELLLTDDVRRRAAELGKAHPQLVEITDKLAAGHGRRGDGVALARAGRGDGAARRAAAAREPRARAGPRTRAHPCPRPRRHQRGVPRRQLGRRRVRGHGADRPRSRVAARHRRGAHRRCSSRGRRGGGSARSGWTCRGRSGFEPFGRSLRSLLGTNARRSPRGRAQPAEAYRGDIEAVVTDVRGHLAAGRRVVTIHQGHGPAQRMVEVLGEHDVPRGWSRTVVSRRPEARASSW